MNQTTKFQKIVSCICFGVLMFFCLTITSRVLAKDIFYDELGIKNCLIEFIFFDAQELLTPAANTTNSTEINWAELYPFENEKTLSTTEQISLNLIDKINKYYDSLHSLMQWKFLYYSQNHLAFYDSLTEGYKYYTYFVGWNYSCYAEYNSVIELNNKQLTIFNPPLDVTDNVNSITELSNYCADLGIDFLYVQAPYSMSKYEYSELSDVLDFTNQRADNLLKGLAENNISYYDLRDEIHAQELEHCNLFYLTDHHWTTTTGLWAAQQLTNFLNEKFNYELNASLLDTSNFDYITYKNLFIGSRGKKVSRLQTPADDFTFIYPSYDTLLHYEIPSLSINTTGDFSILYDMELTYSPDSFRYYAYNTYNHGDKPLIKIHNAQTTSAKKILVIKDSFADCVTPFLALTTTDVDILDVRFFTGSVENYIEKSSPDIVIVLYNPSNISEIDYNTHKSTFDFR